MPISYSCDGCGITAESLSDWFQIDLTHFWTVDIPTPASRVGLGTPYTYYFHNAACRDNWLSTKELPLAPPVPGPSTEVGNARRTEDS